MEEETDPGTFGRLPRATELLRPGPGLGLNSDPSTSISLRHLWGGRSGKLKSDSTSLVQFFMYDLVPNKLLLNR